MINRQQGDCLELIKLLENKSIQSESSYMSKIEAGRSTLPEPLPNFCSKDGFHIPNQELPLTNDSLPEFDAFNSPDSLLGHVDEFGEEIESIIAIARKAETSSYIRCFREAIPWLLY